MLPKMASAVGMRERARAEPRRRRCSDEHLGQD
jgi:hypothetical protein